MAGEDNFLLRIRSCSNLNYVTDKPKTACPTCRQPMTGEMTLIGTSTSKNGVVKGLATFMVMDDLAITPMSMISGIALLNKCNIKDFGDLEERMVEFGFDEALGILRTSLQSKITLTDVFLMKQEVKEI